MALQRNEDFNGINCDYWKILRMSSDYVEGLTTAILGLYKDSDTRASDVDNVVTTVKITASGVRETRDTMYPECKASGYYLDGASDV